MSRITDARILAIATNGFEESELLKPRETLMDLGAEVTLASPGREPIQGMIHDKPGAKITPDLTLEEVDPDNFDALLIPGGVANPDELRTYEKAIAIVRAFDRAGKPVAAICHGPWLLVEADCISDRVVTGWPSVRTDLANAGAKVVDQEVAIDGNLITSRKPDDIPAFTDALIKALERGDFEGS